MSKRRFKLISIVSIVLLALVVLLNISATFAYFKDKKEFSSTDLQFGDVKINANNAIGANSYFATSSLENVKPGDYVLNDDVQFSLDSTSEPAYIRAKYKVSSPKSKNLFDINNLFENRNSDISVNGNVFVAKSKNSANCGFKFRVPTTIGKTYTVSVKDISWDSTSLGLFIDSGNGQDHASYGTIKKTVKTVTFTATTEYVYIQAYVCYKLGSSPYTFSFEELQLEEGSTATAYQKYFDEVAETDLAGYLKYGTLTTTGMNLLDVEDDLTWTCYTEIPCSLPAGTYTVNWISSVKGSTYAPYLCLDTENGWQGTHSIYTEGGRYVATLTSTCSKVILYSNNCYYNGSVGVTSSIQGLRIMSGDVNYYWSDKIGDYYYLLDASTGEPLVVSDSSKTYTFISKENSKIAENYFSNLASAGTSVNLSIGIEAIQVANLAGSDTTKTTLELIKENLDNINNVSTTGTYSVNFVVDGTTYSVSSVGYGEDATIPDDVITKIKTTGFGGFAFSENGYPVITKTSCGHSWIDLTNKKLKNITENLTLYAVDGSVLTSNYVVTFKNGTNVLQTTRVLNGKCEYLGDIPTKDATNTKEYEFAGWQINGTGTIYTDLSTLTISNDTTLVASFTEKNRTFEITYVLNGGAFKNSQTSGIVSSYTYGTTITLPQSGEVFKEFCTFEGWFETEDCSGNAVTTISATDSGNKTYYAKWTYNASTVTLNLAGGGYNGDTSTLTRTGLIGSDIEISNPTKDDWIFAGWGTNSTNVDYTQNATLEDGFVVDSADFTGYKSYRSLGDGSISVVQDSTSSTGYSLKIETKNSTDWAGGGFWWSTQATANSNYVLKVRAKISTGCNLWTTHNVAGMNYKIGSLDGTDEWKDYYIFLSVYNCLGLVLNNFGYYGLLGDPNIFQNGTWYVSNYEVWKLNTNSFDYTFGEEDLTLTACWLQKRTKIIFDAEGGTMTQQNWGDYGYSEWYKVKANSVVKVGDTKIGCPKPSDGKITKEGYTFAGWWTGDDATGEMLIDANGTLQAVEGYTETGTDGNVKWIRKGDYSDITLHAKWIESTE